MKPKTQPEEPVRGRPGRRSVADRSEAVKALLSGKASIEQLSQKYGVSQETIESWRAQALDAIEGSFRAGPATSDRQKELEKQVSQMKSALTRTVMDYAHLSDEDDLARAGGVTADDRIEVQPWMEKEGRFSFVTSDPRAVDLACYEPLAVMRRRSPRP